MRASKALKFLFVVGMVAATLAAVSVVLAAEKPAGTDPPTVDGLLDDSYGFFRHFEGSSSFAPGDLYISEAPTDEVCYWALVVPRSFNENVYSEEQPYLDQFGWPGGHGFFDLYESDGAQFDIVSGTVTYTVWLDYLNPANADGTGPYKSGQASDDYADAVAEPISDVATSLYYNMVYTNSSGWTDVTESPPITYNEDTAYYWEWQMIYEFSVSKQTGGTCAEVTWAGAHNSPTKNGNGKQNDLASLGDYVWLDTNGDGVQDDGEYGVPGVTVTLYYSDTSSGSWVTSTTQTNDNGYYHFTTLEPGQYYVHFLEPAGYDFTARDVPTDTQDSDADPVTGKTVTITLNYADYDMTWDAGLIIETDNPTAVTVSAFAAGLRMSRWAKMSLGVALMLATGGLLWVGAGACRRERATDS